MLTLENGSTRRIRAYARKPLGFAIALAVSMLLATSQSPRALAQNSDASVNKAGTVNPYADNNGIPLPESYSGPVYKLNHSYPQEPVPPPMVPPWREALDRVEGAIDQLVMMVQEDWMENSTLYMPVTRDLSAAKRLILETWGDLVIRKYPQEPLSPLVLQT